MRTQATSRTSAAGRAGYFHAVMCGVWLNPLLQPTAPEETRARCAVFRRITASMGLEIIDDEITEAYVRYTNLLRGTPE